MMLGHKLFGEQAIIGIHYVLFCSGFHGCQKFMVERGNGFRLIIKIVGRIVVFAQI
jgi:hypothetical protein